MENNNLFHNASLRLTAVYLVIIVSISLLFSIGLYRVSSQELEQSLKRPITAREKRLFGSNRPAEFDEIIQDREDELQDAQSRLRGSLVFINVVIIVSGGGISYMLARRTLRPIEYAHESQSRFTADASHELRTPITAMRAETELALTESKLTLKEAKKQLESNIEELDKLTSLSEGLLRLAVLDHNNLEKETVPVSLIIQKAIDRVLKKAEQKEQIIATAHVSEETIHVNQIASVEALVTLLDNAVKYSPEKSEILVTTKSQSKFLQISVSDKGTGIQASELPHIFERFFRADSSRTNSSEHGYGIGLSIAKSVAESHGGTISAKSNVGNSKAQGSTFTLSFPKKRK